MNREINAVLIIWLLFLTSCSVNETQKGIFVSTKNSNDTLVLDNEGIYFRIVRNNDSSMIDEGNWYYKNNRLWFNGWVNRGEVSDVYQKDGKRLVAFSFDKSLLGKITYIYFDVDDYHYYELIKEIK